MTDVPLPLPPAAARSRSSHPAPHPPVLAGQNYAACWVMLSPHTRRKRYCSMQAMWRRRQTCISKIQQPQAPPLAAAVAGAAAAGAVAGLAVQQRAGGAARTIEAPALNPSPSATAALSPLKRTKMKGAALVRARAAPVFRACNVAVLAVAHLAPACRPI